MSPKNRAKIDLLYVISGLITTREESRCDLEYLWPDTGTPTAQRHKRCVGVCTASLARNGYCIAQDS